MAADLSKPLPGIFQIMQIGKNIAVFGDEIIKVPVYPTMEETFQALMSSPLMRTIFPNVTDASKFFGQMMNESLSELSGGGVGKILKILIDSKTNRIFYGFDFPGGVGTSIAGGGKSRGG